MTRFLRTADFRLVNADHILRIEEGERVVSQQQSRATLSDGISNTLVGDVDEIERALLPVVAAASGYVRLGYYDGSAEEGGPGIRRMPIVAWRIDYAVALPVTPDDDGQSSNLIGEGVLLPDGRVVQPFAELFDDEAAWVAEMDRQAKGRRKPKAAE